MPTKNPTPIDVGLKKQFLDGLKQQGITTMRELARRVLEEAKKGEGAALVVSVKPGQPQSLAKGNKPGKPKPGKPKPGKPSVATTVTRWPPF